MKAIGTEANEGNKGRAQISGRSCVLFVSFVTFCSKKNGQALLVRRFARFGQDALQPVEEPIDFGSRFGVELPGIGPAAAGGGEQPALDEQVLFDGQKAVEPGLQL